MYKKKLGLVHVYTGNGKGKTTMAMGIALRSAGQNLNVHVIQFLKGGYYTGEFLAISNYIPQITFEQYGKPCIKEKKQLKLGGFEGIPKVEFYREDVECGECRWCFLQDEEEKRLALKAFERAKEVIKDPNKNVVILDEIIVCLARNIFTSEELLNLIKSKHEHCELVLTGRYAPKEIIEQADLASEMKLLKHPFMKGIPARKGIEY